MDIQAALPTFHLDERTVIAAATPPQAPPVSFSSPALSVMTDLTQVKAAMIAPSASLRQAEQTMIQHGVRMLFVVAEPPALAGLISVTDLHGERQMRLVHERHLRYDDLAVVDVMTTLAALDAVDHERLRGATVADLVATLRQHGGRHHLLVVERGVDGVALRVRGVVSRAQIERQTGTSLGITPVAQSFSEIERALF